MPISHGSNRWTVIGANVERLPNERFTVTLNCRTHNLDSDWYANNKDKIFKDFGDAYSLPLEDSAGDAAAWSPQTGEAYPNLVLIETQYQGATGDDPSLIFVYETLTSTWTLEDEALSTVGENGLLTLSEDLVAIGGTALPYDEDNIGVTTKVIDGTTTYLAGIQDEGSQRKGAVTILWAEAGILSETIDNVGSQKSKVIETIGVDPTTPDDYSLASKQESNVEGFQTNRFTFLKDNVELSRSEDKVGSQLSITTQVFNPTSEAITGIDTSGTALAGYSEADRTESDYEGIKTISVQFLKPSILSLQQDFNNGRKRVSVEAFGMTGSDVSDDLTTVIGSHKLISQTDSDYEGIKTSTFLYQADESFTEDYELNGFTKITLLELSATNFLPQTIGGIAGVVATDPEDNPPNVVPSGSPLTGLYLGSQSIDNGGTIKTRSSVWTEAGILSISPTKNNFSLAKSYTYRTAGIKASDMDGLTTPSGDALTTDVTWFEPSVEFPSGFPTFTQVVLLESIGEEDTQVKIDTRNEFYTVTDAGIMQCDGGFSESEDSGAAAVWPRPLLEPVTYRKKATVEIFLTSSGTFDELEVAYSEEKVQWCSIGFENYYSSETNSSASASGSFRSFPNYLNSNGASIAAGNNIGIIFGRGLKYQVSAQSYATGTNVDDEDYEEKGDWVTEGIYRVNLEEYTKDVDGNQLYLKTIVTFPGSDTDSDTDPTPEP